jgi:hypothetical protein
MNVSHGGPWVFVVIIPFIGTVALTVVSVASGSLPLAEASSSIRVVRGMTGDVR